MAEEEKIKVYGLDEIDDVPFPQEGDIGFSSSQASANQTFANEAIQDNPFPSKKIAYELLAPALNTRSKKILQEFQFTQSGALQIGKYENGVSGDLRLSPTGILGRDSAGNTTFAIDATTGDAIFRGTLRAGTIIADDANVVIEEAGNGNGRIVFYNNGIPAILIGDPS